MKLVKVQGVVIKETNTGEADKIITIFTSRLGRIQASVRGARRSQSRLIAGTQLLSFSDFVLFKGKDMYSVRNCDLIEPFYNIRSSLEKLTYTTHIIELVTEITRENLYNARLMPLLLNTLYTFSHLDKSPELISRIFEIRMMSISGYTPELTECVSCGGLMGENIFFSPKLGGTTCRDCSMQDTKSIKISEGTLSALRYIIFNDIKKIFSFNVSPKVLGELKIISERFIFEHLDRSFNKLKFLETLNIGEVKE